MTTRPSVRSAVRLGLPVFALAFLATVTLVTIANNGWYPVGTSTFCGSLGDFQEGPVPTVCLSIVGYWTRAASHPPYAALAIFAGLLASGAALAWRYASPER